MTITSLKRIIKYTVFSTIAFTIILISIYQWISRQATPYIFTDSNQLTPRSVGLVLGTAKYLRNGKLNPFYQYRIEGAVKLYQQGKIKHLLLSGDHSRKNYNEPETMQQDLIRAGIPASSMTLDYGGLRTLDSILRAKKIFQVNSFTIITQSFHCDRAILISRKHQLDTQCYAVPAPTGKNYAKVILREILARVKAVSDLYIRHKQPKFLGKPEPITFSAEE
ncbi:SanA/YdcF family protein [Snodgrassella alvi]|jgi:SanA protein|uniref:SanA/YdcF family protein n=1 Tax=Snodgrassella alvi TaxID=1196083 RepID=UPI000C1E5070|nr:ElyC/SanA/YdcF family protein [Snodgrassella alvi]